MKKGVEDIKTSLEIDEDISLHKTGWLAQRIGWCLMLTFLILAALGLFGDGMMSERKVVIGQTTAVFERYLRRQTDTRFELITVPVNGSVRVSLSPDFLNTFKIDGITPEPAAQEMRNGHVMMEFPGVGQAQIIMYLKVRDDPRGAARSEIRVNEEPVAIDTYIYP